MKKYDEYIIIDMDTNFSLSTLLLYAEDIGNHEKGFISQPLHDGDLYSMKIGNKIYCYWNEWGTEFSEEAELLLKECKGE